jgi:hypothetical protein
MRMDKLQEMRFDISMQLDDLEKARDAAWKKLTEKEQEIHEIE